MPHFHSSSFLYCKVALSKTYVELEAQQTRFTGTSGSSQEGKSTLQRRFAKCPWALSLTDSVPGSRAYKSTVADRSTMPAASAAAPWLGITTVMVMR